MLERPVFQTAGRRVVQVGCVVAGGGLLEVAEPEVVSAVKVNCEGTARFVWTDGSVCKTHFGVVLVETCPVTV